jgi:hypothetical protein
MIAQPPYVWPDFFNIGVAPPVERGASALSMVVGFRAYIDILDNLPTRYALGMGLLAGVYPFPIGPVYNAQPFDFPPDAPLVPNPYSGS